MRILGSIIALVVSFSLLAICSNCAAEEQLDRRRIAITFDDAPRPADAFFSRQQRGERIIAHLAEVGATAAFFATTGDLDDEGLQILRRYGEAGHVITNHSHLHRRADTVGAEQFLADMDQADAILSELPGFAPFFRFPYLNEGTTSELRDRIRAGMSARGYRAGYVTIDNYDWYLNRLVSNATSAGAGIDRAALGDLYVEILVGAAEHYDGIARRHLGRSPAHVLLLHENDLAALYLDDLIAALRSQGWEIVSVTAAYADEIARTEPETLFLNQGRVAALAHQAGASRASLISSAEDEAWIDRRFAQIAVRGGAHRTWLDGSAKIDDRARPMTTNGEILPKLGLR